MTSKRRIIIKSLLGAGIALGYPASSIRAAGNTGTVYFLSGTPSTLRSLSVGSTLYRFSSVDNSLMVVRQVVSHERGSAFIETDYDRRMVVVGSPPLQVTSLSVIDMDAPELARTIQARVNYTSDVSVIASYLLDIPSRGLYQALCVGSPASGQRLVGINLSAGVSAASSDTLSWEDLRYVHAAGLYGGGEGGRQVVARVGQGRTLMGDIAAGRNEGLGLQLPPGLNTQPKENLLLSINTKDVAVLSRGYNAENVPIEPGIMYVFNKRMQIWQRLRIPGAVPWVRSFGTWVAGIAAEPDREGMRESPGRLQRIVTPLKNGARQDLTVDHVFQSSGTYFPGELFLYNSETGRMYNIQTRQGDSEVLLVANDTLFYRVNDSIYRVRIGATELGEQTRMVTDQPVAGIHWAFFGPAEASASPASR